MYIWFVYALLASIVVFSIYSKISQSQKEGESSSQKKSIPVFFFILMIFITIFYYIGSTSGQQITGGAYNLNPEQDVGFPPF